MTGEWAEFTRIALAGLLIFAVGNGVLTIVWRRPVEEAKAARRRVSKSTSREAASTARRVDELTKGGRTP